MLEKQKLQMVRFTMIIIHTQGLKAEREKRKAVEAENVVLKARLEELMKLEVLRDS